MTAARQARVDPSLRALAVRVEALASRVGLVGRATPLGYAAEVTRLILAARARSPVTPRFVYRPSDDLDPLARALDPVISSLGGARGFAGEIGARAAEARLETELARGIGAPGFAALAATRFTSTPDDDARAARWARLSSSDDDEPRFVSDDGAEPRSLLATMRRAVGALRLPVRVVAWPDLAALAATGDGVVQIAEGRLHTERQAQRIVVHELEGHVLPRLRRAADGAPMRAAGAVDLEEGRALVAERRAGLLDRTRRAELGRRHVAATRAHAGADLWQIVEGLEELGERPDGAVRMAARALRGGGLGRERVYAPAYRRASAEAAREHIEYYPDKS